MEVAGSCVKLLDTESKYGVRNTQEVRIQYPCKLCLSSTAWTPKIPYSFMEWTQLNQQESGAFVDFVGRVANVAPPDMGGSLPTQLLLFSNGHVQQEVRILGGLVGTVVQPGDIVACASLQVKEYRSVRSLETSFFTVLEVNPSETSGMPDVPELDAQLPKRKAMRMTPKPPMSVIDVQSAGATLKRTAELTGKADPMNVQIIGKLPALTPQWFEQDPPLVGDPARELMCWVTTFTDTSGSVEVKVWDKACRVFFDVAGTELRSMWEKGVESSEQQEDILKRLNKSAESQWRADATLRIWSTGTREKTHRPQVHINIIEEFVG